MRYDSTLVSLEVLVVPQGMEADHHSGDSDSDDDDDTNYGYHKLEDLMKPFRILRNVGSFKFRDAKSEDMPCTYIRTPSATRELPSTLESELQALIESRTEREYAFNLHQRLVYTLKPLNRTGV